MSELFWRVELENGTVLSGTAAAEGEVRVVRDLPAGVIRRVTARVDMPWSKGDRAFVNGFQSWTYCPEYTEKDKIRGLGHLPGAGVRHFGLDRYGDNYFVDYPVKKGKFHGETWAYIRTGGEYRLAASLDEKPGYTLIRYDVRRGQMTFERDCAGLRCGGEYHLFDLYFARGSEDEVFDGWFAAMAVTPRTREPIAGYSSWYNRYEDINEECIRSDLEHSADYLQPGDLFQIDDGWEPGVGDWLEPDEKKFPGGMKAAVDGIHERGLRAGLWLAPFVAREKSRIFAEHPGWFLLHDGKPWFCGSNWGGFYSLDIDHPGVRDYLTRVFRRVLDEWGFDLVKLDFLYGAAPFGTEQETRAARMIRAMDFLRELCGDKLILGCGVPLAAAFGRVEYCRIGCDVSLDWNDNLLMQQIHRERVSTKQSLSNTVFRRQLNGRAFLNDPDVFFLREENIKLTPEEKRRLALGNTLLGDVWLTSDDMGSYNAQQAEQWRQLRALREAEVVSVDTDRGVSITYRIGGEEKTEIILPAPKEKKKR